MYKCKLELCAQADLPPGGRGQTDGGEREKRSNVNYLVNAGTLNGAVRNIDEVMGGTMIDYVIASVSETTLMDVFEYKKTEKEEKPEYEQ